MLTTIVLMVAIVASLVVFKPTITLGWLLLIGIFLLPRTQLFPVGDSGVSFPVFATLLVGIYACFAKSGRSIPFIFVPLVVYLLVLMAFAWEANAEQWAALLDIGTAILAWAAGTFLAKRHAEDPRAVRWWVLMVFIVVSAQALVCLLQGAGLELFAASSEAGEITEGRSSGTWGHPGNLGKAVVMLVILVLPLTRSSDPFVRRCAFLVMPISLIPVGLSASRTNFIVLAAVLIIWALLLPRDNKLAARLAIPAAAVFVALAYFDQILARFLQDPGGGQREHFLEVFFAYIQKVFFFGTGPGASSYISYFGLFDSLTARGWPVHNAFLLITATLGIFGAILFLLPAVSGFARAFGKFSSQGRVGLYARAGLVLLVATVVIGMTGWSLFSSTMMYAWFFACAYVRQQLLSSEVVAPAVVAPSRSDHQKKVLAAVERRRKFAASSATTRSAESRGSSPSINTEEKS